MQGGPLHGTDYGDDPGSNWIRHRAPEAHYWYFKGVLQGSTTKGMPARERATFFEALVTRCGT